MCAQRPQTIWPQAVASNERELRDGWHALNLLEASVSQISRYLDRHRVPVFERDISRLLMRSFFRALRRKKKSDAQKLQIVEMDSLERLFQSPDCFGSLDYQLDAAKVRTMIS